MIQYKELIIAKYFDNETMSIHLKENVVPMAKKGTPGNINLVKIGTKPLKHVELEKNGQRNY